MILKEGVRRQIHKKGHVGLNMSSINSTANEAEELDISLGGSETVTVTHIIESISDRTKWHVGQQSRGEMNEPFSV